MFAFLLSAATLFVGAALAADNATHTTAVHGYDLVAYQTRKKIVEGNDSWVAFNGRDHASKYSGKI